MACPTIYDLEFDQRSIDAILEIKRKKELADVIPIVFSAGVFASIFAGNSPLAASFNVATTDWREFSKAMYVIPDFARNRIEVIAGNQYLTHPDPKQRRFWGAIYNGCSID
ncbi:MAG: hypothetical protein WD609_01070 [Aquisalimonadaceae bacterium]